MDASRHRLFLRALQLHRDQRRFYRKLKSVAREFSNELLTNADQIAGPKSADGVDLRTELFVRSHATEFRGLPDDAMLIVFSAMRHLESAQRIQVTLVAAELHGLSTQRSIHAAKVQDGIEEVDLARSERQAQEAVLRTAREAAGRPIELQNSESAQPELAQQIAAGARSRAAWAMRRELAILGIAASICSVEIAAGAFFVYSAKSTGDALPIWAAFMNASDPNFSVAALAIIVAIGTTFLTTILSHITTVELGTAFRSIREKE